MAQLNQSSINETDLQEPEFVIIFAGHLLIAFYCLIFIFGFLGNSAVIFVAIRKKKYRNVTNCYVVNLAVADLLFLTVSIPHTTYLGLVDQYPLGELLCNIYTYLAYVFLLATCYTLAAMSIDRYLYIVLPKGKLRWRTSQNAFSICLIIWTMSLILIIPYHIISNSLMTDSRTCQGSDQKNFLVCFLVFCSYYAIPLLIIIVCYTKLASHVVKSNRSLRDHMQPKNIPRSLKIKQQQVTRMVVVVTLAFAISWLPIHTLELMNCFDSVLLKNLILSYPKSLYTVRAVTHALAYFNSCLNPYLYALLNRNFCFDLLEIIPRCSENLHEIQIDETRKCKRNTQIESLRSNKWMKFNLNEDEEDDGEEEELKLDSKREKPNQVDVSCQVNPSILSI